MTDETTTPTEELQQLAARLWYAQRSGEPCEPLSATHASLSVDDAYTVQTINVRRRLSEEGLGGPTARLVGHKIGLTSRAVQDWLGVAEPDFGVLLDDMMVADSGLAPMERLLQPRAEGEIAFVLKDRLCGPGVTAAHVISATDYVLPAIEIVDSRIQNWEVKLHDTVADNASSGMFVLGTQPTRLDAIDLPLAGMTLRRNGRVFSTGAGAACLDNPVNAVVWLANKVAEFDKVLSPGEVILSGALGPVVPVRPGDFIEVRIAHLGSVAVRF